MYAAQLTELARLVYEQACELRGGSDLTVVEGDSDDAIRAASYERLGYAILKARDVARENGL